MTNQVTKDKRRLDGAWLEQLLGRAMDGNESCRDELRKLLDDQPHLIGPFGGDLARNAERALVRAISGKNLAQREAIHKKMAQLRAELAGPNQQPLERLLVERVVLCWLHACYADCQYAQADKAALKYKDFLQRQQDRAQRRYLAAIKSLTTVRRLALPIKLDMTVAATVEGPQAGPSCRVDRSIKVRTPAVELPLQGNADRIN